MRIATIVVTYNRKLLLRNCLDAIGRQTLKPNIVYIIDNASTDGTMAAVIEWEYYDVIKDDIQYRYIKNDKNEGGAGGFCLGLKIAFECGDCDAYWLMDDDGVPSPNCLERLVLHLDKYEYLSPMVVDVNDCKQTSFMGITVTELLKRESDGVIENECNPFNGVLFSDKLVSMVGFPKREMFIWGDEINYTIRAEQAGFVPAIITDAIFRHPMNRQQTDRYFCNRTCIVSESNLKLYCMLRNMIYNYRISTSFFVALIKTLKQLIVYNTYYLVKSKDLYRTSLINKAIVKGFMKDFDGLDEYIE